jgi:cystathionine beta-lyase/cystathionine gamma-synthase
VLEANLAAIDGGDYGVCYSSGMAAVDSCLKLLSAGDHVVCSDDVYGGTSRLFNKVLARYGLDCTYVDTSQPETVRQAIRPETKMLWVETPTNPLLKVTDLEAMAAIAKDSGLYLGVDSTFATPVFLRPLEFGADIVMHSTTKYLSGHNQIIGGVVVTNRNDINDQLKFIQKTIGAVPSPFDCWLALLGVKTLHLRMQRHAASAQLVAEYLESHPKVARVIYPGLPSHPQYTVAKAQMSGFSGMIAFELKGGTSAGRTMMNSVKLCGLAESLGAVETMITHPATMTHAEVPAKDRHARGLSDGLVRLSVGIEDVGDILADLEQALEAA